MAPPSEVSSSQGTSSIRAARTPGSTRRTLSRSYSSNVDVASSQHNAAAVIEFGSAFIRAGLAGESTPRHIIEADELPLPAVGRSSSPLMSAPTEKKWEGLLYPLMSKILTDLLLVKPRSRRVLIVEPFISPTAFRSALCRVLLNWMNVPCVLFVSGGMVAVPYALGMNGGLVVDVGRWEGRVVCVSGGRYLTNTFQAVPCGFENLANSLMLQHNSSSPSATIPTLDDANSILLQCLDNSAFPRGEGGGVLEFRVPSTGQTGSVPISVVQDCLHDMYFDPSNPEGLLHAVLTTMLSCPVDLRVSMVQNVSLVGGGVLGIPNFERTLLKAIFALFDPADESESKVKARFAALAAAVSKQGPLRLVYPLPFAPQLMPWIGGSILGTLGMSDERWVFRQFFMEQEEQSKLRSERGSSGIYDFLAVSS